MLNFFKLFVGDIVNIIFTVAIIGGGIWVWLKCSKCREKLNEHADKLNKITNIDKVSSGVADDGSLVTYAETKATSKDDIRAMQKEFDEICAECDLIPQYIAIFPSVGILGTVFGLMIQAAAYGIDEMTASIGVALSSTFLALIATIILKLLVTGALSKTINRCEVLYANYARYRRDMKMDEDTRTGVEA